MTKRFLYTTPASTSKSSVLDCWWRYDVLIMRCIGSRVSANAEAYPVHYACQYEQIKCLRLLIEVSFPCNVVYRAQGIGK